MVYVVHGDGNFHLRAYHPLQYRPTGSNPLIEVFIQLLWIIEFRPVLYMHFLGLFRDIVVLFLESTLNVITSTSVVGSLFIISVLHIAVAFIIISIAHIAVTFVITTTNVIIIL
jgi:hypothetical protein